MSKLITKFKYFSGSSNSSLGRYAKYIATREGVEKLDESVANAHSSKLQDEMIRKLIKQFPDSKQSLEYEDYKEHHTVKAASEFISRTIEDNSADIADPKIYLKYIATRPGAVKRGMHGLFSEEDKPINLSKVAKELDDFEGNIWTVIVSLRREDAVRLKYESAEAWQNMIRSQVEMLAKNFNVPMSRLKWYAAFHNESHHPHIHMVLYDPLNQAHLSKVGVKNIRSALMSSIFQSDIYELEVEKNQRRDALRKNASEEIKAMINRIRSSNPVTSELESKLVELANDLKSISGRHYYKYMPTDIKAKIDAIVDELEKNPEIAQAYAEWYDAQDEIVRMYRNNPIMRVPLSQNETFKTIRNSVIKAADDIGKYENDVVSSSVADNKTDSDDDNDESTHAHIEMDIMRLICDAGSIVRSGNKPNDKPSNFVETKLRREINEKKQAHGQKM